MKQYHLGEVVYVDLNPTKGVEANKKRPCVIVSNDQYNQYLNTVIIAPISNAAKYVNDPKYSKAPMFIRIPENDVVTGTILLQHLRCVDPKVRITGHSLYKLPDEYIKQIQAVIKNFF
ncbi:type II toxin-antitoxin system PemK/MazF family toxin [Fundicoccus culcitae]|uniref:Type II toxin-antitoxin system PemK/MazF family toxin n=1 Tax=Fundicoccus culcitae TaxID=2969821 RepID=A0ABY5P514_9LACT|nr:type II toxin-antitoxin system PemK/MazF family toxin [Fundicoccus culcitae]UUX33832.1 type II toxin-antitoxin system PemK/MazF family toxin [Fundicoccus culcitae]